MERKAAIAEESEAPSCKVMTETDDKSGASSSTEELSDSLFMPLPADKKYVPPTHTHEDFPPLGTNVGYANAVKKKETRAPSRKAQVVTAPNVAKAVATLKNPGPSLPTGLSGDKPFNWKKKLCDKYARGQCKLKKEECSFAHGQSDIRVSAPAPVENRKKTLCTHHAAGYCSSKKEDCNFAHGVDDMPEVHKKEYKMRLCWQYYNNNSCDFKKGCKDAHGEHELRCPEVKNKIQGTCDHWKNGFCYVGKKGCKYLHK
eukprot:TRINITY_DN6755_c1_g1_i2.p1 TRINITY_DN6755_c1_g1~~TRINITY_DN6755_c1_g1_i2.p1  ORF type:complete len:258 (+),score=36.20 TRINITY_DN6755_c1_g1_i2:222-995(+)